MIMMRLLLVPLWCCVGTTLSDICPNKNFELSLDEEEALEPRHGPMRNSEAVAAVIRGRDALEIGGPTPGEIGIYGWLRSCDNVAQFADPAHQRESFDAATSYWPDGVDEAGKYIIADAETLAIDKTYGVVYASHVLEHMKDPLRALLSWDRVLEPGGALFLILPWKNNTFDQYRPANTFEQLAQKFVRKSYMSDFEQTVRAIDMDRDYGFPPGSNFEDLRRRTLGSPEGSEMLHYHVFDLHLLKQLLKCLDYDLVAADLLYPFHQIIVGTKKPL